MTEPRRRRYEAVEACTPASEMVERLGGTYIHDDGWDEEKFVLEP